MIDREFILGKLPPYQGNKQLVKRDQDTDDIIKEMILAHKQHSRDYDNISGYFWKGDVKSTCKFIFDFLKRNVRYSIEPDARQSVKSPASILATGYYKNGYNDCKHYSQFFSGILDSLKRRGKKINWLYRFANYRIFTDEPQHVFVVATDGNNEFWCDPVLKSFNERKPYINKIDKKMSLYKISGMPNGDNLHYVAGNDNLRSIAGAIGRRKKGGGKKKKGLFKKIHSKVHHAHMVAMMAPSRAAYTLLVKINPFKMVNKLAAGLADPAKKQKMLNIWYNLGGNKKFFEKLILKQYAHWKKRKHIKGVGSPFTRASLIQLQQRFFLFYSKKFPNALPQQKMLAWRKWLQSYRRRYRLQHATGLPRPQRRYPFNRPVLVRAEQSTVKGIGAVQLVAVLAAAVPVITALAAFMPKGAKGQADAAAESVTPAVAAEAANNAMATATSTTSVPPQYQSAITQTDPGGGGYSDAGPGGSAKEPEDIEAEKSAAGGGFLSSMSTPVKIGLAAGAAAAVYFITKKRKSNAS